MYKAAFQWKDMKLPKLHSFNDEETRAFLQDYVNWKDSFRRGATGVGAAYIFEMIDHFAKINELIPMFGPAWGVPLDPNCMANYNNMNFLRAICVIAQTCGKEFKTRDGHDFDFAHIDADVNEGIKRLKIDLASFGVQVKEAAKKHHNEVFIGNDAAITAHPLCVLIKWKLLAISFNPFKASAPSNVWKALNSDE